MMMPNMDGFTMCRELRSRRATQHTPILVATGLHDHGSVDTAYEAGATDFIVKPVEWETLPQRIRYMLRRASHFSSLRGEHGERMVREDDAVIAALAPITLRRPARPGPPKSRGDQI